MFGVTDLSEHDNCINLLFLCLKIYLHRCKSEQTSPNFVAVLDLVKIKRNTEYKIAESKGKLRQHFKKWTLDLEASYFFGLYFCLFALHRSYHHPYIFGASVHVCLCLLSFVLCGFWDRLACSLF